MKRYREWNPEQNLLLPRSIKEFVPVGHPAHFVRELVRKELDLTAIRESYEEESRGAPPFAPEMMTALLLYAYSQGVYSSRRMARGCEERLDFVAITALNYPDFRTISLFRKRHHEALGELFQQVLKLCRKAGMVKLGHVAIDGSKISANASKSKGKKYSTLKGEEETLEQEIKKWLDTAQAVDREEDELYGEDNEDDTPQWMKDPEEMLRRVREAKKELEEKDQREREERERKEKAGIVAKGRDKPRSEPKPERRYNFTDPDSEVMKGPQGFIQGYNTQLAVDAGSHVIVAADVTTKASDHFELLPMLDQVRRNCGQKPQEVSADATYCSEHNLAGLEKRKVRSYIAVCSTRNGPKRTIVAGSRRAKMWLRLKQGGKRSRYWIRGQTVEPVFGNIKHARGFRQFLLRGLQLVKSEFALIATVHNLLKLSAYRFQRT